MVTLLEAVFWSNVSAEGIRNRSFNMGLQQNEYFSQAYIHLVQLQSTDTWSGKVTNMTWM